MRLFVVCFVLQAVIGMTLPEVIGNKFLYFAYGSNLLAKRIHIKNPTAVRKDIGKLKNHRLDFFYYATRWGGAPSTVVPAPGENVWGAIWEIDMENLDSLDKQEGVHRGVYQPLSLPIETPRGETLICRVYQLVNNPDDYPVKNGVRIEERKPSYSYIQVLINGAIESGLPEYYVEFLKSVEHNGNLGKPELISSLNLNLTKSSKEN
ncbi:gamma-glutamylcyclotransferase-like isoform X1 [Phlebotomus argentipes]|uniref:gamma-glutamylcyclotransferase-like isoform X1 n=2 Tax=Phlebotomus argentipes TaxID=94469 RepID=UPI00289297EA|nr:gamma-glutamylcyclotransferase-like isoform X1 [Phlebotomus argentipes]